MEFLGSPYMALVAGWAVYFFLHSFLATERIKSMFHSKYYRLWYNATATIGLLLLLAYNGTIKSNLLFARSETLKFFALVSAAFGVIIINLAFKRYDVKEFLGFRAKKQQKLDTGGILNHVRHPLYSGTMLIVIGFFLFSPYLSSLVSAVCILFYLAVGIHLEEKKLIKEFGDQYLEYKKRVPMLIPKSLKGLKM